ncbi:hypothetical protein [Moraxella nonliquefaciens]|uniref:hypothetical protein n=1 Tax=Moraxella nonliquefaciens TaxID=478 RepID=UPI0024A776B3|nr:hypothetical protein [Moraxella nonliquefaciens]
MNVHGSKKGSSKQRQPIIAPDSAQSKTYINILYGLGEGELQVWQMGANPSA